MTDIERLVTTDHIQVEVAVRLGRTRMSIAELGALTEGSVLPLDRPISDGVEICVGDHVVAHGELVVAEDDPERLALRITRAGDVA